MAAPLKGEKSNGWNMGGTFFLLLIFLSLPGMLLYPESFRTNVHGSIDVTLVRPANEASVTIGVDGAVLINLNADTRFVRGIELEITAPQAWLQFRGALGMLMFNNLNPKTGTRVTEFDGSRIAFEPLPARLRTVYHIPIRQQHGLRPTTSVIVPTASS